MFSKAFAVITNVIGQGTGKDLPYEAPDESYSCLSGKTIWEVKRAKRKVCFYVVFKSIRTVLHLAMEF